MVLGQLPQRKIAHPNDKTNPNQNPNHNQGSIFLRGNGLAAPSTLKLILTLTESPTLSGEQFSSGCNRPDTFLNIYTGLYLIPTI